MTAPAGPGERLLIFDFDGVIADSELLSNRVFAEELTAIGLPTTLDEAIELYMGKRFADCVRIIEERLGRPVDPDLDRRWAEGVQARIEAELGPVSGVSEFLDATAHHPRCVASSSPPRWLEACLARFGLSHHFDGRLYSGAVHVERGKPHPDLFLYAAADMRADPARAVVIEDSPTGVKAGAAAGMTVIGLLAAGHVRDGHGDRLLAAGATHLARDYGEVAAILASLG
jgi:HAD superfamily hydrolase (TIGR01509 family)